MEREGLEIDLKNAELNYQEIVKSQADIKNENKKERKKMEMKEEALQKQVTELKKGISEERSIAGTLLGRMKNDMEEYERAKLDAEKKRLAVSINIFKHISIPIIQPSSPEALGILSESMKHYKTHFYLKN